MTTEFNEVWTSNRGIGTMEATSVVERRRHERRELQFYYAIGFVLCLPLVCGGRVFNLFRGKGLENHGSAIAETSAKVSDMLGFMFMA